MKTTFPLSILYLTALGAVSAGPIADDTAAVCNYLSASYPDHMSWDPESHAGAADANQYNFAVQHYWNSANADNRPLCVFFPSTSAAVSDAVKQLNQHPRAKFALKSGGHNFNKGISSVDGGVLLSFNENLSSVTRSADGESFEVGPGARWGDAYKETSKTNQIVVGGRLANIGVGGFVLGGGLSYYSAQYGLSCDNVLNFEVVLPDGTIANANSTSNPDLFWALKGGGNRFAIVTKFTLQAHPAGIDGQIWGGVRIYSADDRHALFSGLSEFVRDYPDAKAAVIPTFDIGLPNAAVSQPMLFFFYDGPTPPEDAFSAVGKVKPLLDLTSTQTYPSLTSMAGGAAIYGISTTARVNTFPNMEPKLTAQLLESHWNSYTEHTKNDSSKNLDIQFSTFTPQPISTRVARATQARGGNALGLDPDNGDRIWVENDLIWVNPVCDEACPSNLRNLTDEIDNDFHARFAGQKPTNYKSGDVDFIS